MTAHLGSNVEPEATAGQELGGGQQKLRGVYFGGDATNPTLILRINSFLAAGVEVTAFTFRRAKFNTAFQPTWRNIHLGATSDRRYVLRLPPLLSACRIIARHRSAFDGVDFLYARMLDMVLLALFAKLWFRLDAKIVYEVEDVQAVFFQRTLAGAVFRWIERRVLARTQLLVAMSPGFVRGYFTPTQGYRGPSFVLQNKIQLADPAAPPSPAAHRWRTIRDKWVIGWFGTLRCSQSMEILSEIAERLSDRVEIYTRGYPTETGLEHYTGIVDRNPNWTYEGEYTIPRDLAEMYGRVHFTWCLDFLDVGGNSELLLACRMYQGGFYGSVPLVGQGSEMERFLAPHSIGHAFAAPFAENIAAFLEKLSWEDYARERERILALGRTLFLEDGSDMRALLRAIREAPRQR
jgi:succinoglycan biosynthesis protein ExoL